MYNMVIQNNGSWCFSFCFKKPLALDTGTTHGSTRLVLAPWTDMLLTTRAVTLRSKIDCTNRLDQPTHVSKMKRWNRF